MTWAGRPVKVERERVTTGRFGDPSYNVYVDDVFVGFVERYADGWAWKEGFRFTPGERGSGEPTRGRAVDALLAQHTKSVDAWSTP